MSARARALFVLGVRSCRLCSNRLGNEISDDGAVALAEALTTNTSVIQISLECENVCIRRFAADHRCVLTLRPGNNIGIDGAKAIANALKTNASLTRINLSCEC